MKDNLVVILLHLLACLPLSGARVCGRFFGLLTYYLNTRMASTTRTNVQLCFPEMSAQAQKQLIVKSLQHTFQTIAEAGAVWLWPAQKALATICRIEGESLLKQAYETGRGVLVIAPHLGNWELFGLYLNASGIGQSYQMYQPPSSKILDDMIRNARSRAGATMVPTNKSGVSMLLSALKKGEIVGVLPDQVPPQGSGEYARFFNRSVLTMTLITRLQQKTGAVVLTGYARRSKNGFEIIIREANKSIYEGDLRNALEGLNKTVEDLVKESPDQYQWEYKRFKKMENEEAPYKQ